MPTFVKAGYDWRLGKATAVEGLLRRAFPPLPKECSGSGLRKTAAANNNATVTMVVNQRSFKPAAESSD
jgi:hypothetical protein